MRGLPSFEYRATVVIELYRVRCPGCGIKAEKVEQLPSKAPFSKRLEAVVGQACESAAARKFGVHRRLVRQAPASAIPPERKIAERESPQLEPVNRFIDEILEAGRKAPRKQRPTAHRIWRRIRRERPECQIGQPALRRSGRAQRQATGTLSKTEVFIEQS